MIVLCPVHGLVRRRHPAAHRNTLTRWIKTVNPLTIGFVKQSRKPAIGSVNNVDNSSGIGEPVSLEYGQNSIIVRVAGDMPNSW